MTLRAKLLLISGLTVMAAVALVGWVVSAATRREFERLEEQRIRALVEQFRREFARRGGEIVRRVGGIAGADAVLNIAIATSRDQDYAPYVNEAAALARAQGLDLLELVAGDGTIISSAQWPARFGYHEDWLLKPVNWNNQGAFLKREQLPDFTALAMTCVRVVTAGDQKLYVVGGQALDRDFMASLVLPAGMRALLYRNLEEGVSSKTLTSASGPVQDAANFAPLIAEVLRSGADVTRTIAWNSDPASAETFHAIPLKGREDQLLGALLVGSSRKDQVELERFLRLAEILAAGAGMLLAVLFTVSATGRATKPVQELAIAARKVAAGNWDTHVPVRSRDEIGALAQAFNQMTRQLLEQRDRLIQAERVAAWRELARRLAHELKNPLFPLQITVENMQRAHERYPEQFDEVFKESSETLLAELANLQRIVARFSDFAKMPAPELQPIDLNELVLRTTKLFDAQLRDSPIQLQLKLDPEVGKIHADPEQLSRAMQNLILNAIDAMPAGGMLWVRTAQAPETVHLEVSDTGEGLTREECHRLFTPYYTTKRHGTGLGLAIVQSVVSDHGGRISVESEPGQGTTFRIELKA